VSDANTAWMLVCTALVLFMTPGLAVFYGGMVRSKNVLGTAMQSLICIGVVSLVWAFIAYSLAFGPDVGGVVGSLKFAGLEHLSGVPGLHLTFPPLLFAAFQMMFAVITAALISGAGAGRLRFTGFAAFVLVWSVVVYAPLAHWVFSPHGWLAARGVLDFAGGSVVEINSGASGLALVLVIGAARGWPREAVAPHSLPLTVIGAGILWFGWFGFNAGSALSTGGVAVHALVSTHLAACAGMLAWLVAERARTGHATTLGGASGAAAGLVAITPAAGYVDSLPAMLLGAVAGVAAFGAVRLKFRLGYDDTLDVVGVHYVGGFVGMLLLGIFASHAVNPAVHHQGLAYSGSLWLLGRQALAVVVSTTFAFTATYVVARLVNAVVPLRCTPEEEYDGLDQSQHAESAYDFGLARTTAGRIGT